MRTVEKKKKQTRIQSFKAAFNGIGILIREERNFRIHLLFTVLAIGSSAFFQVTKSEWITVLLLIALVLSAEAVNSCIEYLCDWISPEYHPMVKKIKDVSAGMVLMFAIAALITGCIIFIPYIISYLT
jgi:diacylglycerol kinase